ncbi:MAG: hypothetical protein IMF02_11615 [Proteobacteria bacterium]|nr:hypothetical protein [Pseudomonadota bacterium]
MFRLYETQDGLLIPASMLGKVDNSWVADQTQPVPLSHSTAHKTQRRSKTPAEKPSRDPKKKDVDDRQLKLFDDE